MVGLAAVLFPLTLVPFVAAWLETKPPRWMVVVGLVLGVIVVALVVAGFANASESAGDDDGFGASRERTICDPAGDQLELALAALGIIAIAVAAVWAVRRHRRPRPFARAVGGWSEGERVRSGRHPSDCTGHSLAGRLRGGWRY